MLRARALLLFTAALLAPGLAAAQGAADPVVSDPTPGGAHPPSMDEVRIPSHGVPMNGLIYLAGGVGPHPVVLFLHGYPGNERNLDLAQAVRRAGYDAVFFDYRGSWGAGGTFSLQHGLEDVQAALAWVRDPAIAAKYHLDSGRVALVGHSYGGGMALQAASREPATVCVAGLAPYNPGGMAALFPSNLAARDEWVGYLRQTTDSLSGPSTAARTRSCAR